MIFISKFFLKITPKYFSISRTISKLIYIKLKLLFIDKKYRLSFRDFQKLNLKNKKKEMYILGSGSSIQELDQEYFRNASKAFSFASGRWYTHEFVPDILFLEFDLSKRKYKWLKIFADDLNKKKCEYSDTLILVEIPFYGYSKLRKEFLNRIEPELRNQIRFVSLLSASACKNYLRYVLNNKIINFLTKKWSILLHCRSSISLGISISRILDISDIFVAGVDGYKGYFIKHNPNWGKLEAKDTTDDLHSSANPEYGIPTINDCFVSCDELFNIKVSSKKTRLYEELISERKSKK